MARKIIALCDHDLDYAVRVANAANRLEGRRDIEVVAFGDPAALWDYVARERPAIFAVNEVWKDTFREAVISVPVVWLSESPAAGRNKESLVFKYQSVPELIRELCKAAGLEPLPADSDCSCRRAFIVAVWSAGGGTGKSTLSALLSEEWSKSSGEGVFCVSLEAGATAALWLTEEGRHDVSGWLYDMKCGHWDRLKMSMERPGWNRVESFRHDGSIREITSMSKQDAAALIRFTAGLEGCKTVIIDCDSGWSERTETAWEESDFIICLHNDEPACSMKMNKWLAEWPGWQKGGAFRRKAVFVVNKAMPGSSREHDDNHFSLPYVPEWKQTAERTIHRHPAFQRSVKQLMHRLGAGGS